MSDSSFDLSKAAALFSQQTSTINSLWTVYVAATFAAAGYGLSGGIAPISAAAITFGFTIFALGNWSLIKQGILLNRQLGRDMIAALDGDKSGKFDASLRYLASTANPLWVSATSHLIIDACVLIALWSHVSGSTGWLGGWLSAR